MPDSLTAWLKTYLKDDDKVRIQWYAQDSFVAAAFHAHDQELEELRRFKAINTAEEEPWPDWKIHQKILEPEPTLVLRILLQYVDGVSVPHWLYRIPRFSATGGGYPTREIALRKAAELMLRSLEDE
jgi:hypothetical protein